MNTAKPLTYREASELTGLPRGTLARMVSEGKIPILRYGPRTVRFDPDQLKQWIDSHRLGPTGVAS